MSLKYIIHFTVYHSEWKDSKDMKVITATTGWECKKCTFRNTMASGVLEICKTIREVNWKCSCDNVNKGANIHCCLVCGKYNPEIETIKVARNPDNSWDVQSVSI